jgi:hypothetical protein
VTNRPLFYSIAMAGKSCLAGIGALADHLEDLGHERLPVSAATVDQGWRQTTAKALGASFRQPAVGTTRLRVG